MLITVVVGICSAIITAIAGWFISQFLGKNKLYSAKLESAKLIEDAKKEANNIKKEKLLEAKDEWYKLKQSLENEYKNKSQKFQNLEKQLQSKEQNLEKRIESLNRKEKDIEVAGRGIENREKVVVQKENSLNKMLEEEKVKLEKIAMMTAEEAKKMLMENMVEEAKHEVAPLIKEIKEKAKQQAIREAKEIIISAIQRTAADHSVETTVSVVNLPAEDMKGRIIGKEGRNIRAFETATGVDVIIDDTPEAVILSGFDPLRREIAKLALEKLIVDGRIHPTRIEELVEKSRKEMEDKLAEIGEQACLEVGVHNVHPEIMKLLGRLQYRTSYGQNVLQHCKEVALLSGLMAGELGFDGALAKRAGLLHDIGKSIDRYTEGTHTAIGVEVAKKYHENPIVINGIAAHHEDVEPISPISVLVAAADAISGARPGARRETLEAYVKRLQKLEEVGNSFNGVAKTYAIQAGREIRVIVEPDRIDDAMSVVLASDIAKKIQEEMEYPGVIKVTVLREFRAVDFAK